MGYLQDIIFENHPGVATRNVLQSKECRHQPLTMKKEYVTLFCNVPYKVIIFNNNLGGTA